jgi:hypothetical protein
MSQSGASPASAVSTAASTAAAPRLHGRALLLARVGWVALTLLVLALNVVMLPRYDALLQAPCPAGVPCFSLQSTAYDRQLLHQMGLSLGFVADYQVMLTVVTIVVYSALAALLFWRKSADRMALFCACMLVVFGGVSFTDILLDTLAPISLAWFALIGTLSVLGQSGFVIFFLLFPSGRFAPRWTRWVALVCVLYWIYTDFFTNFFYSASAWSNLVLFALLLCVVGAQIYRYRRVSTRDERQQTKWVVFGFAMGIIGFVLFITAGNLFLPPQQLQSKILTTLIAGTAVYGLFLLIPISMTIAILRSRLYDIDTIINKALVYGLLTGLLGALYAGLIIGLTSLAEAIAGSQAAQNPVVVVVSTLAIAALFLPLRRRLQALIDRRFYRHKYDAEKTLAAFSATLRNEVDLEQVREHLIAVVQEIMQPAHVSLWLRPPERQVMPEAWRSTEARAGTTSQRPPSPTSADGSQSSAEGDEP